MPSAVPTPAHSAATTHLAGTAVRAAFLAMSSVMMASPAGVRLQIDSLLCQDQWLNFLSESFAIFLATFLAVQF